MKLYVFRSVRRAVIVGALFVGGSLLIGMPPALSEAEAAAGEAMVCNPDTNPYCHELPRDGCASEPCDSRIHWCCLI